KFSFGSSVSGKLDPRRHPGEEPSDCLEVCDVLPIRTGRLLDRHTRPQCAVGEVIQNGVGNLAQEGDPPGAIGLQHGSGLRRTAHRLNRRDQAGGARRLEKVPSVHTWRSASCLCKTTLLRAGSWKLETESLLNWPIWRFGSGSLQIAFDLRNDIRMLRRNVGELGRIVRQVVQLERLVLRQPNGLPVSHPDRLLESALVKLPVHEFVGTLRLSAEDGQNRRTVKARGNGNAGEFGKGGKKIPMRSRIHRGGCGGDRPRPAGNHRHANAALIHVALDSLQPARALEELWIAASLLMRTVVAREEDERPLIEPSLPQEIAEAAHPAIHTAEHLGDSS